MKGNRKMKQYISFSNMIFIIAIAIFVYGVYNIYIVRKMLPVGVCPIDNNRPILFLGVFFMLISILVSYIEDKIKRNKVSN